jgi:tight adherence protein B
MARRLRALSAGGHGEEQLTLTRQRALAESPGLARLLIRLPRVATLDRVLIQAGSDWSIAELFSMSLAAGFASLLMALLFRLAWPASIAAMAAGAAAPTMWILRQRARRLGSVEKMLPDTLDLVTRALRAGHSLPTALKLVGDEMRDPIGSEFRTLSEEINFGVPVNSALANLTRRIPSRDLEYLVVALAIQRETGGNLAELLENIASIVRERLKLFGEIRTLSAEGRLSAWILSLLPFGLLGVLELMNPQFLSVLWNDPFGTKLVVSSLVSMAVGIVWMRSVIRIRV